MRRGFHDGHTPRPLHEEATKNSGCMRHSEPDKTISKDATCLRKALRVHSVLPAKLAARGKGELGFEVRSNGAIEQALLRMADFRKRGRGLPLYRARCCVPGMR